jgi:hypothetical protein
MLNMMMVTSQLVDLEHTLQFHQPILVAIEQRDPELASRLMTDHLTDARDLLLHSRQQETTSRSPRHGPISPQAFPQIDWRIAEMNKQNCFSFFRGRVVTNFYRSRSACGQPPVQSIVESCIEGLPVFES